MEENDGTGMLIADLGRLAPGERILVEDREEPDRPRVEYMPVPRCDTCRWWRHWDPPHPIGSCAKLVITPPVETSTPWLLSRVQLPTRADFGCVQHEAKDE